jgi:hypothetical protein
VGGLPGRGPPGDPAPGAGSRSDVSPGTDPGSRDRAK